MNKSHERILLRGGAPSPMDANQRFGSPMAGVIDSQLLAEKGDKMQPSNHYPKSLCISHPILEGI